uniref:Leucine rich repeat containing 32 n=1 Tax=Mola mola TaxID=94237 RepID=A0A3Q3WB72_MOLML
GQNQSWNNHSLHSVPLDLDATLRRLDLSNNFIRQLHTLALPYLEQLDLSSNQLDLISEGAFENLAQLKELNLSRNALSSNLGINSKALQSISGLKTLDLSMNGLDDDAVEQYLRNKSFLDHLKMSGNTLTRLSHKLFQESKSLRHLEMLSLVRNNLAHICDFKLHQVKYLNLSRNSVEFFVTHEDNQFYRLEILDLSHNKLLYFPIIPKMSHLKYLHLQNNMVGALTSEAAMVSEVNALKNSNWRLMPVIYIDLSFNHFTSFPLETLSILSSLETLNFSHNCLQNIIWNVRNDNAGRRRQHLQSFQSIHLLNLNTACVVFQQLRTLKHLNLKENNIEMLLPNTFQKTSLVSLNLAGNSRMIIQAGALEGVQKSLQSLIISEINMTSSDLPLPCMPVLTQLDISNNNLNVIPSSLGCSPLREIDIRNNHFVLLNHSLILSLSANLNLMYISGNHFNCCENKWLKVLHESKIKLPDINDTVCFTSDRNIVISNILNQTLLDCSFHQGEQEIHFGRTVLIFLFVSVILTVLIIITRKQLCTHTPCIV